MKRNTMMGELSGGPGVAGRIGVAGLGGLGGVGLAAILLACGAASAQTTDAAVKARQEANRRIVNQPIRSARSVRPPVIDLEAMARERRPGQVMPGDGYASGAMPYGARREVEPIGLPDSARPMTPKAAKRTDVPTLAMPKPAPREAAPVVGAAAPGAPDEPTAVARAEQAPAPIEPGAHETPAPPPVASIPIVSPAAAPNPEPAPSPVGVVGVDALLLDNLSAPLSTSSARVVVAGLGGVMTEAQWRTAESGWQQPRSEDVLEGKIEVRAGINGEVTLVIDGQVQVTVSRLGRIVVERAQEQDGTSVPTIALARGAIDIRPADSAPANGPLLVRVRTPDQAFGVRNGALGSGAVGVRVEYDAFTGTHRRASNP